MSFRFVPAILTIVGLLTFLAPLPSFPTTPTGWPAVTHKVQASLVRVSTIPPEGEMPESCSGFVINSVKEYILTAEHCHQAMSLFQVDKKAAWAVLDNEQYDLMVMRVEGLHKPALHPSQQVVEVGTPLAALGYAYGLNTSLLLSGSAARPSIFIPFFPNLTWLAFDKPFIGGMSGGPIFDSQGDVVGIIQKSIRMEEGGGDSIGLGQSIADIMAVTGKYWEEP